MRCWMLYGCMCWTLLSVANPIQEVSTNPSTSDIPRSKTSVSSVASPLLVDWQMANEYFNQALYIQSLARVEKHLMDHPGDGNAQYLKVHILQQLGECEQASILAEELLQEHYLLYADWIHYLQEVVEQAQPDVSSHETVHYPSILLPWEA